MLYCNGAKIGFKLLKINVLNSLYLKINAYICNAVMKVFSLAASSWN